MDTITLVAVLQIVIAAVVGYVAYLGRRDAKRATLISVLAWIEDHRKETAEHVVARSKLVASDSARKGTGAKTEYESDLEKARDRMERLHRISRKVIEETDRELGLNGDLMEAFGQESRRQEEGGMP
jgi:hypothetical protein